MSTALPTHRGLPYTSIVDDLSTAYALSQNATRDYPTWPVLKVRHKRGVPVRYGGQIAQMLGVARGERVMTARRTRRGLSDAAR